MDSYHMQAVRHPYLGQGIKPGLPRSTGLRRFRDVKRLPYNNAGGACPPN